MLRSFEVAVVGASSVQSTEESQWADCIEPAAMKLSDHIEALFSQLRAKRPMPELPQNRQAFGRKQE